MHTEILFKLYYKGGYYYEHGQDSQEAVNKIKKQYPGIRVRGVDRVGTIVINENGKICPPEPVKISIWKRAWNTLFQSLV